MGMERPVLYNYSLKGSRNYVQGATMFESFCRVLRDNDIGVFDVKELKFHRELHHNGRIILRRQPAQGTDDRPDLLVASMSFAVKGEPAWIGLWDEPASAIVDREEDLTAAFIKEVCPTGPYESQSKITHVKDFGSLLTALVEVNKRTHIHTLNDVHKAYGYRLVLMRNLGVDVSVEFPEEIEVKIKHRGLKRGKDGKDYTLNTFYFSLGRKDFNPMLGFAYKK